MIDNIEEIKNKLEKISENLIIGQFDYAYQNNNFIQMNFTVCTEESPYVKELCDEGYFDNSSLDNVCIIKYDSLKNVIMNDPNYYEASTYDEEKADCENFLTGKVVLIKPYFYYNEKNGKFYKNGIIKEIIDINNVWNDLFFSIPVLNNEQFYKYENNEPFSIENIDKDIYFEPEYLLYDNIIYKANLKFNEDNLLVKDSESLEPTTADYFELLESGKAFERNDTYFVLRNEFFESIKTHNDSTFVSQSITKELDKFYSFTKHNNLYYTKEDIYNFYTCISSSELTILAGMSGMGKTRLPLTFAKYFNMSEEEKTLLFVPISPSYLEPSDVLGFLNPNTDTYVPSQTGIVELLLHAQNNPTRMHMIIFDEMNLSQIEYWFAPFLSLLEQDVDTRKLILYSTAANCNNSSSYPSSIKIGKNVIFVGTVNLDETTKNISDRLKDRAFIINLSKGSFLSYQEEQKNKEEIRETHYKKDLYNFIPHLEHNFNYIESLDQEVLRFLDDVHECLNDNDKEKGISFRTVKNIAHYLHFCPSGLDSRLAIDLAFKQTVMKKIYGTSENLMRLISIDSDKGNLYDILDKYLSLSDFEFSKKEIDKKILELKKYGYAR